MKSTLRKTKSKILILNGSPHGNTKNCGHLIDHIQSQYPQYKFKTVALTQKQNIKQLFNHIKKHDAVLFMTGTYWDSWGSPLQKFLEDFTNYEGHPDILGKPAGVISLMHSVGGKSVLSRLQGVLNTYGFLIPPMSGMTYGLINQLAEQSPHAKDFWCLDDISTILANLEYAAKLKHKWSSWPVDRKHFKKTWIE